MKTMRSVIALVLIVGSSVYAQHGGGSSNGWKGVRGKGVTVGLSEQQIDHTLNICRQRGMSAEETDELLAAVYTAHEEGLPADNICIKIEEGLAKQVPADRIKAAAESRLNHLRAAAGLVATLREGRGGGPGGRGGGPPGGKGRGQGSGQGPGGAHGGNLEGPPHLVENIGMALESGVPLELFQQVFTHAGNARMGRIMPVVDAAEALHLGGLKPAQIQRILIEVLDRNFKRHDIQDVVAMVLRETDAGKDFETVYRALWPAEK